MLVAEKYIMIDIYNKMFYDKNEFYRNQFINNKMIILQWITPQNLEVEIKDDYLADSEIFCNKMAGFKTATEKLFCIIEICKMIYKHYTNEIGQDDFIPIFIYTFLHFKVKDLLLTYRFITRFLPVPIQRCTPTCLHLKNELCGCLTREYHSNSRESTFYLTNFEAMFTFIERCEFGDINVDQDVYNEHIQQYLGSIDGNKLDVANSNWRKKAIDGTKKQVSQLYGALRNLYTKR